MKTGRHDFEVEAPDLAIARIRGDILPDDAAALGRAIAGQTRDGTVFLLSVLETSSFGLDAEARRAFIHEMRDLRVVTDAVVGAGFHVRVLARLLSSAARVLTGLRLTLEFFDDEASARVWLRSQGCVACRVSSAPDNHRLSS